MNTNLFPKMDRSCIFLNQIISHSNSESRIVNNNNSILPKIMQGVNNNNNTDSGTKSENGIIRLDIRPLTLMEKENYQRQLSIRSTTNKNNNPDSLSSCFEENIKDSLEQVQKYHQLLSQKLETAIHEERLETVSSFVKSLVQRKKDSEIVSHCFNILKKTKDEFETLKKVIAENERIKLANRPLLVDKAVQYEEIILYTKQEEEEEVEEENNQDATKTLFNQPSSSQESGISESNAYEQPVEKQEKIEDDDEENGNDFETSISIIPESQPIDNLQVVYVSPNDDFIIDDSLKSGRQFFSSQTSCTEFSNVDHNKTSRHVQFDTENIPSPPIPSDNVNDSSCPSLISPTQPNRVPLNTTSINIPPIYQEVPADILKNSLVFTEPSLIKVESSLSSSSSASSIISKYTNYISPQKGPIFSGKLSNKQNLKKIYGQDFIGIQTGATVTPKSQHSSSSAEICKTKTPSNESLPFKISKNMKTPPKVLPNTTDDFTPLEIPVQIRNKFRPPFMRKLNLVPFQDGNQAESRFHPTVSTTLKKTNRKRLTSIAKVTPRVEIGSNGKPLVQTVLKFSFQNPVTSDVDKKNDMDEYNNGDSENKDLESLDFVS